MTGECELHDVEFDKCSLCPVCEGIQNLTRNVTRVEVIDHTGRAYTKYNVADVEISLQDDNRTLKIFIGR